MFGLLIVRTHHKFSCSTRGSPPNQWIWFIRSAVRFSIFLALKSARALTVFLTTVLRSVQGGLCFEVRRNTPFCGKSIVRTRIHPIVRRGILQNVLWSAKLTLIYLLQSESLCHRCAKRDKHFPLCVRVEESSASSIRWSQWFSWTKHFRERCYQVPICCFQSLKNKNCFTWTKCKARLENDTRSEQQNGKLQSER